MPLKRFNLPVETSYPVRIAEVHVTSGQFVQRGTLLCTLEESNGELGVFPTPVSGTIKEGPVEIGATFSQSVAVIGLELLEEESFVSEAVSNSTPSPEAANSDRSHVWQQLKDERVEEERVKPEARPVA